MPPASCSSLQSRPRPLAKPIIFFLFTLVALSNIVFSQSHNHVVGGWIWSIPISDDFYTNWSGNQSFFAGDNLIFRFETGMSDVVQVSRREFESCSSDNVFRSFDLGPATVALVEEGILYFICSYGNHCFLGQKVSVQAQRRPPPPPPPPPA
ncbi:Blue copper protein [Platanthera guangdongensis]|uniref:Blue copper protein n=1 Tax=Platanthera guangdongensis TaxID=2320717 RepID=A0ABR2MF22_9ASPA